MKDIIVNLLSKTLNQKPEVIEKILEIPPNNEMGDFAFPCFFLAKEFKKSPNEISKDLKMKIKKLPKEIEKIEVNGPYLNFFLNRKKMVVDIVKNILVEKENFGKNDSGKKKKILIDMSSPNIAKPFGIGHLRSTIIGNSLAEICKANGYEVIKINYLGDWGTQFGKIILGFKKWGDEKKLNENPILHLYELYVKANGEEFEDEARKEFAKLEQGDKENLKLWKKFKELSLREFNKIYDLLDVKFDVISGESLYNDKMDDVLKELEEKKLLIKDAGAKIVDLKDEGLGVVLIQKSDGTSLYATRDIAMAIDRKKKYDFYRVLYEVGAEQKLQLMQWMRVLEKMGYKWSKDLVHVAHGLYLDKDGKKFSTRRGKTVFMKDILEEVLDKAKENLLKRNVNDKDLDKKAKKIALSAIFYGDLKNNRENNMIFDIDRFLAFEGDTGPYLLYSYARANSILKKVAKPKGVISVNELNQKEIDLAKKLDEFSIVVKKAYENLSPSIIANYAFQLAQIFNEFYHECPVINSDQVSFRRGLVESFKQVLGNSLSLLGIETLDEM